MALPSLPFLRKSERVWKARHTWRSKRLDEWRARESYRYWKWHEYRHNTSDHTKALSADQRLELREKWWKLYEQADIAVDKWHGLRDEASGWLKRRRGQIDQYTPTATSSFRISEFDCKDGTPVPKAAYPALERLCEQVLEPMRARFGACHVNSGYRHRRYNAAIGGASQSEHIYDLTPASVAADVTFARGTPAQWAAHARQLGKGGVGQYRSFVHVDNGPRRDWWG
jgi:hypothetical protein